MFSNGVEIAVPSLTLTKKNNSERRGGGDVARYQENTSRG